MASLLAYEHYDMVRPVIRYDIETPAAAFSSLWQRALCERIGCKQHKMRSTEEPVAVENRNRAGRIK